MLEEGGDRGGGGRRAIQLVANEVVLTTQHHFSSTSTWPLALPLCAPERSQKRGNERAGPLHARTHAAAESGI